jgi:sodium/potassium-transporting ATPase subunit alpha
MAMTVYFFVLAAGGWRYGEALAGTDPLYLQATTACLAAIVVAQVVNVFSCRHPRLPSWSFGLGSNPLLVFAVLAEIALILLIVYTPPGNAAFGTAPLPAAAWWLMLALAAAFWALEELRKWFARRTAESGDIPVFRGSEK